MWLDLRRLAADHPHPGGLRVELAEEGATWDVEGLPYYSPDARLSSGAEDRPHRRRIWRFAAWLDGGVVGHSAVFVTTGRLGVAGIYDCGVVPVARNQGVGKAVTAAACRHAQDMGCHHALLNATGMGEPVYRRLGFVSLGRGQTWWLQRATLDARPAGKQRVAVAEAVGLGDLARLDRLGRRLRPQTLDTPLPGGMTLLQIAVRMEQPAAVEWLVQHGATLDLLSAWDLGWKDRMRQALARSPELANRRSGAWQITPMHAAAERSDVELAWELLTADPDLEITDSQFRSTPLGWARHLGRAEIVALIEQHLAGRTPPGES
jgi:GNAT superfamily N-acetyltransferase